MFEKENFNSYVWVYFGKVDQCGRKIISAVFSMVGNFEPIGNQNEIVKMTRIESKSHYATFDNLPQ